MTHYYSPPLLSNGWIWWSKLCWLSLFLLRKNTAVVRAQSSSCTAAQAIQSGAPLDAGSVLQNFDEAIDPCAGINFPASDLPAGHWFTFQTSVAENRLMMLDIWCTTDATEVTPTVVVFRGSSCDSLTCESVLSHFTTQDPVFFETEVGVTYFMYVYRDDSFYGAVPYTLSIKELEPPINDNIENAVALTSQDLPFKGDYTTLGARSDFSLDACGLEAENGVWFSYNTSFAAEELSLQLSFTHFIDTIAIQAANGNQLSCVTYGSPFQNTFEWIAERGTQYFILVTTSLTSLGSFEFSLQSRGEGQGTTSPSLDITTTDDDIVLEEEDPPVAAPVASGTPTAPPTTPTARPVSSTPPVAPSSTPPPTAGTNSTAPSSGSPGDSSGAIVIALAFATTMSVGFLLTSSSSGGGLF